MHEFDFIKLLLFHFGGFNGQFFVCVFQFEDVIGCLLGGSCVEQHSVQQLGALPVVVCPSL